MDDNKAAGAAIAGAAGGALATALVLGKDAKATPGDFENLIQTLQSLSVDIQSLISALGGSTDGEDPFKNTNRFITGQVICTTINQGFPLPDIIIPKNKQLVVKALPGNVGWVYVGQIASDSTNLAIAWPLVPNEGLGLFIKNANHVWVMAPALNDGIAFLIEQE